MKDKTNIFLLIGSLVCTLLGALFTGIRQKRVFDQKVDAYIEKQKQEKEKED